MPQGHSEGRGDGGPRVGAAEADAALRARHGGIVSGDAVVGRVPDGHDAKAISGVQASVWDLGSRVYGLTV